jgi:hypothetical protein
VRGALALLLAAAASLTACRTAEPPPQLPHPYKVVLLPVEGAASALAAQGGDAEVPLALTPEQLSERIADGIRVSHVFSEVVFARPEDLKVKGAEDDLHAAAMLARRTDADLLLRVEVKSARMKDLGNNSSTFWSTLTWFMIPLPIWTADDRTYDTDIAVQASLYDPADPVKPTAQVVASSKKQDLDLWDRGLSPYIIVCPPPFLAGSAESVSNTLTQRAVDQLLAALVNELRTREIPTRFDVDVAEEPGGVRVAVTTRRRLRSLEIEIAGKPAAGWAETALVEEKDSTPERFVYRRSVKVDAKPGTAVRVVAEDEAGGREVRTLVTGGSRP